MITCAKKMKMERVLNDTDQEIQFRGKKKVNRALPSTAHRERATLELTSHDG